MTASVIPSDGAETPTTETAPPTGTSPQYSPSISHDEWEGIGGSGTSVDLGGPSSKSRGEDSDSEGKVDEGEWAGLDGDGKDWEEWSNAEEIVKQDKPVSSQSWDVPVEKVAGSVTGHSSLPASKLVLKSSKEKSVKSGGAGLKERGEKSGGAGLKGRLSVEDIQRLEEQSLRTQHEVDLFADMAPKIATTTSSSSSPSLFNKSSPGPVGVAKPSQAVSLSSALQYQPEPNQVSVQPYWCGVVHSNDSLC